MSDPVQPVPAPQPAPAPASDSVFTADNLRKWGTLLGVLLTCAMAAYNGGDVTPSPAKPGVWTVSDKDGRVDAPAIEAIAGTLEPGVYHVTKTPAKAKEQFTTLTITISEEESEK